MAELGTLFSTGESGLEGGGHQLYIAEELDYDYIGKCTDTKKLRILLEVLESGKEGHYPELQRFTEERLLSLLPEKERNRILRLKQKASPEEIASAEIEINNWQKDIISKDKGLRSAATELSSNHGKDISNSNMKDIFADQVSTRPQVNKKYPPVRGSNESNISTAQPTKPALSTSSNKDSSVADKENAQKRLSGYDFRAWEKFNVDEAISKIDKEEEEKKRMAEEARTRYDKAERVAWERRARAQEIANEKSLQELKANELTEIQRKTRASREKQKGNESYKVGELEEAYSCYSRSLALEPNATVFANRGITAIKLKRFDVAEDDCSRAIAMDPNYVKAWHRRGMASFSRGRYLNAAQDFKQAMKLEPKNVSIFKSFKEAESKYREVEGKELPESISGSPVVTTASKVESEVKAPSKATSTSVSGPSSVSKKVEAICERVTSMDSLLVSLCGSTEIARGNCLVTTNPPPESSLPPAPPSSSGFTRVTIVEDDDFDEEEGNGNSSQSQSSSAHDGTNSTKKEGFTRVQIVEDDESDDDVPPATPQSSTSEAERIQQAKHFKDQGNEYFKQGDFVCANAAYSKSFELDPTLVASVNNRAESNMKLERFEDAISDCNIVLSREPENVKALYRRAFALKAIGKMDEAVIDAKRLLTLDSSNAKAKELIEEVEGGNAELNMEILKKKAMSALEEGNAILAADTAKQCLKAATESKSSPLEHIPILNILATAYMVQGKLELVIDSCSKILSIDSRNFKALLRRAEASLKISDFQAAKRDVSSALLIDGTDVEARHLMDEISSAEEEAKKEKASRDIAESNTLREQGNDAMKKGDYSSAVTLYTKAIEKDSNNLTAFSNRSQALLKLSRFVDAERDANHVLKSLPENEAKSALALKAMYRRALARRNMGGSQVQAALNDLKALVDIDKENKDFSREYAKTVQLLQESAKGAARNTTPNKTSDEGPRRPIDNSLMREVSSRPVSDKSTPLPPTPPPSSTSTPSSPAPAPTTSPASTKGSTHSPKVNQDAVNKALSRRALDVPTEPPKTLYELERIWRGLRDRPEQVAKYLSCFKKSTYKKVFKESLSHDLLGSLLRSLRDHGDLQTISTTLEGFASPGSFSMTTSLMPEEDLVVLRQLISKVTTDPHVSEALKMSIENSYNHV